MTNNASNATRVDVISGFMGAGKTTLISKLIGELSGKEKLAIVENEFGEIEIDVSILEESGVAIKEISGGCICCALFGNFVAAAKQLIEEYHPDRVIVEPTGLGKLSDVVSALANVAELADIKINILATVVDPLRFDFCKEMFGEFFFDQIGETDTIILSRTQLAEASLLDRILGELKAINGGAQIISKSWEELSGAEMLRLLETLGGEYEAFSEEHDHEHDHAGHEHEHERHEHHDYQEEAHIAQASLLYPKLLSEEEFKSKIKELTNTEKYGLIIRGKGYFSNLQGECIRFDYVHNELNLYKEKLARTGRVVFIGKDIDRSAIEAVFSIKG
jgi:G3E family GTPase